MSLPTFTIGGVTGVIQGCGGIVIRNAERRIANAISRARAGKPLRDIYEPRPGCVLMFPEYSSESNGPGVIVSLRDEPQQQVLL